MLVTPGTSRWPETATSGTSAAPVIAVSTAISPSSARCCRSSGYSSISSSMPVAHYEIEVALLQQMIFNPGHHQRGVPFADFRHHYADRVASLLPERPRQVIGPVVQFPRRFPDQLLRALRNRFCAGRAVDDQRNSCL